ncbi:MAG: DUF4112 domain-containing protein [Gemmatimonadetes bacterium]|nr:DUF4112 domain-containing protein [Gemmatimonadota bacterium]
MSEHDDTPRRPPRNLDSARAVARLLDRSLRIPGTSLRFGLDPILGLIPGIGDAAGALASGYILYVAWLNGTPGSMIGRMMLNVGVDALMGAIPVIGDLFDAGWQANARNVALLEKWLDDEGSQRHHSVAILVGVMAGLLALLAGVGWVLWVMLGALLQAGTAGGAG